MIYQIFQNFIRIKNLQVILFFLVKVRFLRILLHNTRLKFQLPVDAYSILFIINRLDQNQRSEFSTHCVLSTDCEESKIEMVKDKNQGKGEGPEKKCILWHRLCHCIERISHWLCDIWTDIPISDITVVKPLKSLKTRVCLNKFIRFQISPAMSYAF